MKIVFGKQISKKDAQELAVSSRRQKERDQLKKRKIREEKKAEQQKVLQAEQQKMLEKDAEQKAKQKAEQIKILEEDVEQQEKKRQKAAKKFTQLVSTDLDKNPGIIMDKDRISEKEKFIPKIIYPLEEKKYKSDDVANKIRNTFMNALTALGGTKGLVKWAADHHQTQFYNMLIKIMPKETNIDIKAAIGVVTFSQGLDKVTRRLQTSPKLLAKIEEELIDVGVRDDMK